MSDNYPELSGYEPNDRQRPLRSKHVTRLMRIVVVFGLLALVIPGVLTTINVASNTASRACNVDVARYYPFASGTDARFELSGPGGFGWQCYAIDRNERETFVSQLGIIPSAPRPVAPGQPS
ncbi:hypothetical protein [Cryobacterium psychrophilum]|uniref:Uncharacterized protein n=1 Tax=Cryobacterium psychrophilum TaxID=41988 RepID=A0A4Y8KNX0_9MICO|nr:hypothetical protein [Cryobacterium psychrophilum]TDW30781.1 hypothetical protein EDD25_2555 [Cryobacterium psychrophilum]TFD75818.1 hypothetical protein E3T53_15235 [Cryobacterium psychrophilum]